MRRFLFPALALLVALGLAWLRDGSPTSPDGNGAAPDRITVQVPTPAPIGKGHSETPEGELVEMQLFGRP